MTATLDPTPQLLEWQPFRAVVDVLVPQTRRRQGSLSLLLVGVDGTEPDAEQGWVELLTRVLQRTARHGDLIARHGPRSMAILGIDTPQAGALHLAQRIQSNLQAHFLTQPVRPFTVSIGVASWPESGVDAADLIRSGEIALSEALAAGGNRARVYSWDGSDPYVFWDMERNRVASRHRAAILRLRRAVELGWIPWIRLRTQPGACSACQDAAREASAPAYVPALPLVGCASPGGCRCLYSSPLLDPRPLLAPVSVHDAAALSIPRKLRGAAFFGVDARRHCSPDELVEYLESYPPLWFEAGLDLPDGEVALLQRPAVQAWERPGALSAALHGPLVPSELPFQPWLKQLRKPPSLPRNATQGTRSGTLFLTNRRMLFRDGPAIDSLPLLQVAEIEYLSDGFACRCEQWKSRLIFLLPDSLRVSLFVARTLRAEVFLC